MTAPPASTDGIVLDGLHKRFDAVRAVDGVDLQIAPGSTVALLGPNGAGKSTTIDMVLGLSRPDRGTVSVFGRSATEAVAAGAIGAMLQTGSLPAYLTVRELLTMLASLYPHPLPVDEVLESAQVADIAGRPTQKLSGGQSQRVRFAVAVISNPQLLVLDEPTVAMDVESRRAFWAAMRAYAASGRTIVFATHYLEEADDFADRIVLMAQGRIVADGPTTEIKAKVGGRVIRATLPGADLSSLGKLPGVTDVESHGDAVVLSCGDSDAAIKALLREQPDVRDIEISSAGLEAAFLELTRDPAAGRLPDSTTDSLEVSS